MATLFQESQFFDNNGNVLSGGHVFWYQAGTTNPKQTWKDAAETSLHTLAYITLDADGRWPGGACFIRGSYKLVIKNSTETSTYVSIDNINEYNAYDFTGLTASAADLNSTTTSSKDIGGVIPLTYTVLLADRGKTLMVNALTGDSTINLPSAATVGSTFKVWIKKTDKSTHTVTIVPFGAQTLDGATHKVLYDYNDFVECRSDGSNWFLGGSLIRGTIATMSIATAITLEHNGMIFNCNTSGGSFNITLPASATVGRGFWIGFKKVDNSLNQATLVPNGSETIDGLGNYFIHTQWQYTQIKTDGNNWFIMDESGSSVEFVTGDVKPSYNLTQNGWIRMNDGSIGNASSGATTRANADTKQLYLLLWGAITDQWCPVAGGRGASAEADFNASKAMTIPKSLGRSLIATGSAGQGNFYGLGTSFGEERHAQSWAELVAHSHEVQFYTYRTKNDSDTLGWGGQTTINSGPAGQSVPFNVLHPVTSMYYLIKL